MRMIEFIEICDEKACSSSTKRRTRPISKIDTINENLMRIRNDVNVKINIFGFTKTTGRTLFLAMYAILNNSLREENWSRLN